MATVIFGLTAVTGEARPVAAGGAGADVLVSSRAQGYGAAGLDKADSWIERSRTQLLWEHPHMEKYEEQLFIDEEDWNLVDGAGNSLIKLGFRKFTPRFKYRDDGLKLDAAVILFEIDRGGGLYEAIEPDGKSRFTLPSFVGEHRSNRMIYHLGWWKAYDIIVMDYLQYTISTANNLVYGAGVEISKAQEVSIKLHQVSRTYPAGYDLKRNDSRVEYLLRPSEALPVLDKWKRSAILYSRQHFPALDQSYQELVWENLFRFKWKGANNFLTYKLAWVDAFQVYNRGSVEGALKEAVIEEPDLIQTIDFQAFRWIGSGPLILAWGVKLEQSVVQRAFSGWEAHLKGVYVY